MTFPKLGPLVEEKGLGWLFPPGTAIPANIQSQVLDWFYYRRICDADENVFQRMFQRKERAVEARFLALASAQAMEVDPLVQELFEATVEATMNGKTVVNSSRTGSNSDTTTNDLTDTSSGETSGETSGKSDGSGSGSSSGTSSNNTTASENFDGSSSDNNTHNAQQSDATSAYPESALSGANPGLPLPEAVTLSHLASLTISRNQTTDGRLGTQKHTNTSSGTDEGNTSATTSNESHTTSTGRSSGTSKNTTKRTGTVTVTVSNNETTDNTTANNSSDNRTITNKGRHRSAQELLIKYMDFIYRCDAILWYVNELEDCFLSVYDDSGVDCFVWNEDGGDGKDGKDGKDGVTYVPHVQVLSDGARIYWTNDGGLPNPQSVEIKNGVDGAPGPVGPVGPAGEAGAQGPAGNNGNDGVTFTPVVTVIDGGYTLSWTNNGGLQNPNPVNIMNGTGGGGVGGGNLPAGGDATSVLSFGAENAGWSHLTGKPEKSYVASGIIGYARGSIGIGSILVSYNDPTTNTTNPLTSTIADTTLFGRPYKKERFTFSSASFCFFSLLVTYNDGEKNITEASGVFQPNTGLTRVKINMGEMVFEYYDNPKQIWAFYPDGYSISSISIKRYSLGVSFNKVSEFSIFPEPLTPTLEVPYDENERKLNLADGKVADWYFGESEKLE